MATFEEAYLDGCDYGQVHGLELTPSEAEDLRPQMNYRQIDAFLNGVADAVAGEESRIDWFKRVYGAS